MTPDPKLAATVRNLGHSAMEHAPASVLDETSLAADPFDQFEAWLRAAIERGLKQPLGMTLATVRSDGRPAARIVLLRGFGPDGFQFHTNYESAKSIELASNPHAALVFWWTELERQVRVEGRVGRVSEAESDAYWLERPRLSRIAAMASRQSTRVQDRATLENRAAVLAKEFEGRDIPRPQNWGGFRLAPDRFEFWQEGPNRLHDRFVYTPSGDGGWTRVRLAP